MRRMVPEVIPDREVDAMLARAGDRHLGVGARERQRFLDEDMDAAPCRALYLRWMEPVGRREDHRIAGAGVEQRVEARVCRDVGRDRELAAEGRDPRRVASAHGAPREATLARHERERAGVLPPSISQTDERHAKHPRQDTALVGSAFALDREGDLRDVGTSMGMARVITTLAVTRNTMSRTSVTSTSGVTLMPVIARAVSSESLVASPQHCCGWTVVQGRPADAGSIARLLACTVEDVMR